MIIIKFSKNIELLRLAIKRSEEQGMLVIVASGNFENERNNDIVPTYPSSFRYVIKQLKFIVIKCTLIQFLTIILYYTKQIHNNQY